MSEDSKKSKGSLSAFCLGTIVGSALGLLYAPRAGEETRRRLRYLMEEFGDKTGDQVVGLKEKATGFTKKSGDLFQGQKERIDTALEAGKKAFLETKQNMFRFSKAENKPEHFEKKDISREEEKSASEKK